MKGASLDGRGAHAWRAPPNNTKTTVYQLAKGDPLVDLKPASPPKTNPWQRTSSARPGKMSGSISDLFEADPPLIKPSQVPSQEVETKADEAFPPLKSPMSCSSSFMTPTQSSNNTQASVSGSSNASPRIAGADGSPCGADCDNQDLEPIGKLEQLPRERFSSPIDTDVIISFVGGTQLVAHRDIISTQSGWFRDNLPPPNQDGTAVEVRAQCAPETAAWCLHFMYTKHVDPCEIGGPFELSRFPRYVLSYCAAVHFRVRGMVAYVLRIMHDTVNEIRRTLDSIGGPNTLVQGTFTQANIHDALYIIYNQNAQSLMKPIRMVMADLLQGSLLWLMTQPCFDAHARWKDWLPKLASDQEELCRLKAECHRSGHEWTGVPDNETMDRLMDEAALLIPGVIV